MMTVCALGACSPEPAGDPVTSLALESAEANDPEGAALPLSIGGRVEAEEGDDRSAAVNCAAALGITAQRLATVTSNPLSNEIALINRAQDFFIARAGEVAASGDGPIGSVEAAVARRQQEKAAEVTQQAQLAIACLRRFGQSVDPQTGEVL
ncbi:MAG: hypothetical protein AAF291_09065 [Pseudomonadota bacterium]